MFNISIEQQVLVKALEYLEPTVGRNTQGMGDNCLFMQTTGNGSVFMYTNNMLEFTSLEAIISTGGNTNEIAPYVDFKRFKKIISSIPSPTVITLKKDNNNLAIQYGNNRVDLAECNYNILPIPLVSQSSVITIPKDFLMRALYGATSIITETNSSPSFNCIRVYTDRQTIEATALDIADKRVFAMTGVATGNNPTQEILIEASKMKKSLRIFEDYNEVALAMDNNNIVATGIDPVSHPQMKTNGMISEVNYYCRRLNGVFPSDILQKFFPQPTEYMELGKEDIMAAFTRLEALQDQTALKTINVIGSSDLQIEATTTQGQIKEKIIPLQGVTNDFKASFRFPHIQQILKTKTFSSDTFELGYLPKYPQTYIIKPAGSNDIMYGIPTVLTVHTP